MVNVPSPAVSFVGRHNSGKTTLIEKVIGELVARGRDVGSVKHHSHVGFDIELPIFTVGQTAELANIHPQTLRQYDRLGLVRPQRTDGGARRYCLRDIARLTRAQRLSQDEGINLSGIARILVLEEENRQLRREVKRMQTGDQESVFAAGRDGNIVEVQRSNRARLWRNAIRRETRELPGRDTAADIAAGATGDSNYTPADSKSMVLWGW